MVGSKSKEGGKRSIVRKIEIALSVPSGWVSEANDLADCMSPTPNRTSTADVFAIAMRHGLNVLAENPGETLDRRRKKTAGGTRKASKS